MGRLWDIATGAATALSTALSYTGDTQVVVFGYVAGHDDETATSAGWEKRRIRVGTAAYGEAPKRRVLNEGIQSNSEQRDSALKPPPPPCMIAKHLTAPRA